MVVEAQNERGARWRVDDNDGATRGESGDGSARGVVARVRSSVRRAADDDDDDDDGDHDHDHGDRGRARKIWVRYARDITRAAKCERHATPRNDDQPVKSKAKRCGAVRMGTLF